MRTARRHLLVLGLATLATLGAPTGRVAPLGAQGLPGQVGAPGAPPPGVAPIQPGLQFADQDYWKFLNDASEPGGYFRSDNFVSNETGFQWVIPELKAKTTPGGVYLGVGPEQNFTYIVNLQPRMAIIFDIRRQNMILHLMYKALMEMAPDRADFLARLFSRRRPPGLDTNSTPDSLFAAYGNAAPDPAYYKANLTAITEWLSKKHGFQLGDSDVISLEYVYSAFYGAGPQLNYSYSPATGFGGGNGGGSGMPDYATLQTATDAAGDHLGYLATEANYRWLKDFQTRNLLVPIVGDFAGLKAIRAVSQFLTNQGTTVMAFYLSNVEQYLFMQGNDWSKFYKNASTLPVDSTSMFIRSAGSANCTTGTASIRGGFGTGGMRGPNLIASMLDQLTAFNDDKIMTYCDILASSR